MKRDDTKKILAIETSCDPGITPFCKTDYLPRFASQGGRPVIAEVSYTGRAKQVSINV